MVTGIGDDNLLELRQFVSNGQQRDQLIFSGNENNSCFRVIQNVGHAFRRFLEINRNRDSAVTVDGEIGGVPFRTIGRKKANAIAGLYTKFEQRFGEAGSTAKKFLAGNILPGCGGPKHLGTRTGPRFDGVKELGGKRSVVHGRKRNDSKRNCNV